MPTIVEKYNALDGRTVTRDDLEKIWHQAEKEGQDLIVDKIANLLLMHEDESFIISIKTPISGLMAPRHSGIGKQALTECGRLKKGYKYQDGKIVKVAKKATKKKAAKKATTKPRKKSTVKQNVDLLEQYDKLPKAVQMVLNSFDENEDSYKEGQRIIAELKPLGYTVDYDLSGTLFDLKKIRKSKKTTGKDLTYNEISKKYPHTKYYVALHEIQRIGEPSVHTVKVLTKTGEKTASGRDIYQGDPLIFVKQRNGKYRFDKTRTEAEKSPKQNPEKEKLRKKVLGLKKLLNNKDLPEITTGLNGVYLADGHQILDDEESELYGEEEHATGLNAAAKDVEAMVNEMILEKIKTGEELPPWRKSWAEKADIPAQNFVTKKPYTGSNSVILNVLLGSVMPTPYYVTFNQVNQLKGQVKEGAKSVPLVYYNFVHTLKDFSDDPAKEAALLRKVSGHTIYKQGKKAITLSVKNYAGAAIPERDIKKLGLDDHEYISRGFLRYYRVFNIADTTGIDYEVPKGHKKTEKERIEIAEAIIESFTDKPAIVLNPKEAVYNIKEDKIGIPDLSSFDPKEEYYSTLFHELVHSTLHETRLNRKKDYEKKESKAQYAFEELIAELGASYLCGLSGIIEVTHINQASYLKGWHEKLQKLTENNTDFFIYATREAQKAVNYIIRNYDPDKTEPKKEEKGKYDDKAKALAKAKALKLKLKLKA